MLTANPDFPAKSDTSGPEKETFTSYQYPYFYSLSFSIRMIGPLDRLSLNCAHESLLAPKITMEIYGALLSSNEGSSEERGTHPVYSRDPSGHHTTKRRSVLPRGITDKGSCQAAPFATKAPLKMRPRAIASHLNRSLRWDHTW